MARRAARRLIDAAFAIAIALCVAMARPPSIPETVCRSAREAPRYDALYADGKLEIAVVLGELDGQPPGLRDWSHRRLTRALRDRGFVADGNRWVRGAVAIDIVVVFRVADEVTNAIATHDVVYYNGHSEKGELAMEASGGYRIVMLDSCWTTQLYSARLVASDRDVLSNTEKSITGSIESFVIVLDGLVDRQGWPRMLATLNARAYERATHRPVHHVPENYRLDASCH